VRATCRTHVIVLDKVILTVMGEIIPILELSIHAFLVPYVFNQRFFGSEYSQYFSSWNILNLFYPLWARVSVLQRVKL